MTETLQNNANTFKLIFDKFLFKKIDVKEPFTFFRISVGLLALVQLLVIRTDFATLYTSKGMLPQDLAEFYTPTFFITLPEIITFTTELFHISSNLAYSIFFWSYIFFCASLAVGFSGRITAFICLFLQLALTKSSPLLSYGVDFFITMSLFYCVVYPVFDNLSLNRILFKKRNYNDLSGFFLRIFQIHVCILYFFSGAGKALGFNWWNGESLWKAINLPYSNIDFGFDFSWMANYPIVPQVMGWGVIIIEVFYPIFIWIPKTRMIWLCLTISMHLGIALVLNLYIFSSIMIVWNVTAFYFEEKEVVYA